MKLDMTPRFLLFNQCNGLFRNIKHFCNFFLNDSFSQKTSYFHNLCITENRHAVSLAFRDKISTFAKHVAHIVLMGSKKQMSRLYAPWVVASVTNKNIFWNWSVTKLPHNSVSKLVGRWAINFKYSPGSMMKSTSPIPTVSFYFNFGNEPFKNWERIWSMLSFQTRWGLC